MPTSLSNILIVVMSRYYAHIWFGEIRSSHMASKSYNNIVRLAVILPDIASPNHIVLS